jgi:hypothetical protein
VELIRRGRSRSKHHRQRSNCCYLLKATADRPARVRADFNDFSAQHNKFSVELDWNDVRMLISDFARMKQPDAIQANRRLRQIDDAALEEEVRAIAAEFAAADAHDAHDARA